MFLRRLFALFRLFTVSKAFPSYPIRSLVGQGTLPDYHYSAPSVRKMMRNLVRVSLSSSKYCVEGESERKRRERQSFLVHPLGEDDGELGCREQVFSYLERILRNV